MCVMWGTARLVESGGAEAESVRMIARKDHEGARWWRETRLLYASVRSSRVSCVRLENKSGVSPIRADGI